MKMFFSVAAIEDFEVRKIDMRPVFLQAKQLTKKEKVDGQKKNVKERLVAK